MGNAIGQILTPAIGVAISPIPLIAIILMLATPRGRANGIAFTATWIVGIGAAVTAFIVVGGGGGANNGGEPADWVSWVKLGVGVLFLLLGAKQWQGRPRGEAEPSMPKWMETIDTFTPGKSVGLSLLLAVVNPKNLALIVTAGVTIAGADSGHGGRAVAGVVFTVVASLCTIVPLGVYLVGGERSATTLESWKQWMARHNAAIMTVLLLVLGVKAVGDAISGLTG